MTGRTSDSVQPERTERYVGCCGAYCRTCRPLLEGFCKGCKLGYSGSQRRLESAKCRIKVCCLTRDLETCADCSELFSCDIINEFFGKNGYKYRKYRESLEFIRAHGYAAFLAQADSWKGAYGRLQEPGP